jgi:lysophospholipase L1-like esterase
VRRWFFLLPLCGCWEVPALITNNLAADWQASIGMTVSTGRVSQWNDQHLLVNNDGLGPHVLSQTNAAFRPYDVSDAHAYRGVLFPYGVPGSHPKTYLNIPASLGGFDTRNTTVYVVLTGAGEQENQSLVWFGGTSSGWLRFFQQAHLPSALWIGTQASTIYPPVNRAILVAAGSSNATVLRWNNVLQTNAAQPQISTTSGGMIAANNGAEYYSGIIYRILIYKACHSAREMDAQVAELAGTYGVLTNHTKQVVCRGASTVQGQNSTMLQTFPFQLWQRYPEIIWRTMALTGSQNGQIGTNGLANTMYEWDTAYIDTLYDAKLEQNWLFVIAGINDIHSGGLNGAATYGRLTNYVAARKAARPWKAAVSTIQNTVLEPATNADYNARIRAQPGGWDRLVDPGVNSPIETRLNNPNDSRYFASDGVHLTNLGYSVLADHFAQVINLPRRGTGFFGP